MSLFVVYKKPLGTPIGVEESKTINNFIQNIRSGIDEYFSKYKGLCKNGKYKGLITYYVPDDCDIYAALSIPEGYEVKKIKKVTEHGNEECIDDI